jgi:hypothetical protein
VHWDRRQRSHGRDGHHSSSRVVAEAIAWVDA